MDDLLPRIEPLRPEIMIERAHAALAEGRTVSHERMTEWFVALERDAEADAEVPKTDVELDPSAFAT